VLGVSLLPQYASFLVFGTMAVVLLLRPTGMLGRAGGVRGTARVVPRRAGKPG